MGSRGLYSTYYGDQRIMKHTLWEPERYVTYVLWGRERDVTHFMGTIRLYNIHVIGPEGLKYTRYGDQMAM